MPSHLVVPKGNDPKPARRRETFHLDCETRYFVIMTDYMDFVWSRVCTVRLTGQILRTGLRTGHDQSGGLVKLFRYEPLSEILDFVKVTKTKNITI